MLYTALRTLPSENQGSPRKLIRTLGGKYSVEFRFILWEMLEPHETVRMDLLQLHKKLQLIKDKTTSLPQRINSMLMDNGASFRFSQLSISLQVGAKGCIVCGRITESCLSLPCRHYFCSLDCQAKLVASDGFAGAKCSICKENIDSNLLRTRFNSVKHEICIHCGQSASKYRHLMQCHHSFCRAHIVRNSHHCPICQVPYNFAVLYRLNRKCKVF